MGGRLWVDLLMGFVPVASWIRSNITRVQIAFLIVEDFRIEEVKALLR
jgi:hypothetical protein